MTLPDMIFGAIFLVGFAAFIITLAWIQFYTRPSADLASADLASADLASADLVHQGRAATANRTDPVQPRTAVIS
jgi:hypothetical protein